MRRSTLLLLSAVLASITTSAPRQARAAFAGTNRSAGILPGHTATCRKPEKGDKESKKEMLDTLQLLTDAPVPFSFLKPGLVKILVLPSTDKFGGPGQEVAALGYASLPRKKNFVTKMDKVVLVGHTMPGDDCGEGIVLGSLVCDMPGLVDAKAEAFLRKHGPAALGQNCPTFLGAKCPGSSQTIHNHLPFLSALWEDADAGRELTGNILPVLVHKQSTMLGGNIANLLRLLVESNDSPWASSRRKILFVFSGDFSHGLPKEVARAEDKVVANMALGEGFATFASKVDTWKASKKAGEQKKAPADEAVIGAAVKLAGDLVPNMEGRVMMVKNSGDYEGEVCCNEKEPVRGYIAMGWEMPGGAFLETSKQGAASSSHLAKNRGSYLRHAQRHTNTTTTASTK